MVLIRGHDAHVGMRIEPEATWAATADDDWETVPLLGEGLVITPFFFPKSKEFGNVGASTAVDTGRQFVSGEFTTYPRYNAPWFWKLVASCFSCEKLIADKDPSGAAGATPDANTHAFAPQSFQMKTAGSVSGLSPGFTIKVWKSGDATGNYIDTFTGVVVTGWTWNQPEDDRATITFRIIAKAPTTAGSAGALTAATSYKPVRVRDLSRAPAGLLPNIFKVGNTLTNYNVRAFSLTVDSSTAFAPAFSNAPDTVAAPGHTESWNISGELIGLIEQNYGAANMPWTEYVAGTTSKLRVRYISADNARTTPDSRPYAIDFYSRAVTWTAAENTLTSGGAPATRFSFECQRGVFNAGDTALEVLGTPEYWNVPLLVQAHVADSDDSTGTAKFLVAARGGNDLNTDSYTT